LIVLLDDLQWADAGSISLLFHLARHLAGSRILVVGAYRAEDLAMGRDGGRHPLAPVVLELQRDFGDIKLDLNQVEGQSFIAALLDARPNRLGSTFRETLFQRTEGHPLFTVELLRGLQERGNLVCDAEGQWVEGATLDWDTLPARVEAVIAERIARLPESWQAMLRAASVEGEEFTAEVLARVQSLEEREVIRRLSGLLSHDYHLVRACSLQRVGNRSLSRYRFRHNLFRQYLYGQLDNLERANLHHATGVALQEVCADNDEEMAPRLAWHFEQAGDVQRAAHYWRQAGDQAMRLSACEEAIASYMRGVALLATLPASQQRAEQEMVLQRSVSIPLLMTRGWGRSETMAALTRAYALACAIGAKSYLASALSDLSFAYMGQGNLPEALKLGRQLLGLAQKDTDLAILAAAHRVIGEAQFIQGELQPAREHMEQALALSEAEPMPALHFRAGIELDVSCPAYLSVLLTVQGYPEQAAAWSRKALQRARELGRQSTLAFALLVAGVVFHGVRNEPAAAESHAQELIPLAAEKGWAPLQVWGTIGQSLGHTGQGPSEPGIAQVQQGLASWQATNTMVGRVHHLTVLAKAYGQAGQIEQGLAALNDALAVVEETGLRLYEAEVWRIKGELLRRVDGVAIADVEACLKQAISVARRQSTRLLELRSTVSLARLWQGQGRPAQAKGLLAPIYGWFSEGFDTPDLVDAHSLLQAL
jgi:tetratricopeptide (TPR) repeat protein